MGDEPIPSAGSPQVEGVPITPLASPETPTPVETPETSKRRGRPKGEAPRPPEFWRILGEEFVAGAKLADLSRKYGLSVPTIRYQLAPLIDARIKMKKDAVNELTLAQRLRSHTILEEGRQASETLVADIKKRGQAWTEEQVERCYTFRERIDAKLDKNPGAGAIAALATSEEKVDRVARRSLGLTEKVDLQARVDLRALVDTAVRVFDGKTAQGEVIDVEEDFTLKAQG